MTTTIAISNQKGGVGKTTTAINLAACLAAYYTKRVLLIDFDPQSNTSTGLGVRAGNLGEVPFSQVLSPLTRRGGPTLDVAKCIIETAVPNLFMVPADKGIATLRSEEPWKLQTALQYLPSIGLDYILIDTPPSIGAPMVNALVAAHWVIVPVRHAIFSLDGLADTIETLEGYTHLGGHTNGADAYRILFTMVDARKKKSAQYATGELATLEHQLFRTVIRDNDDLNQAQAAGLSIFHFSPHCHGAQDYFELTKEILAYEEARTQASKQANEHAPRSD